MRRGSRRWQQYLVDIGAGRLQALSVVWDSRPAAAGGNRWFHLYPDEPIPAGDSLHWTGPQQNWNYMCAECHSTNLVKGYDAATDAFTTSWSEINVACEACHGPASEHVDRARAGATDTPRGLAVDLDDSGRASWIMDPATGIASRSEFRLRPPQQPESCGRCHSRRAVLTEDYEWGRSLFDTHLPVLLEDGLYYADGQIRDEVYVYGSFLQSRMYQAGVSCGDCHDPHSARLKTDGEPSDVCSTCHLPSLFDSREHHGHGEADAGCVDCHMPATTYMGVDHRRDHSFRIPDPQLAKTTASPLACLNCHGEEDLAWAAEVLAADGIGSRSGHYGETIARGRQGAANPELLAGSRNSGHPGIARGTMLSLLRPPYSQAALAGIRDGLQDAEPFVRLGALQAAAGLPAEQLVVLVAPLLRDSARSLRIEAVRLLSPLRQMVPAEDLAALRAADAEWLAALSAVMERAETRLVLAGRAADVGDDVAALDYFSQAERLSPDSAAVYANAADFHRSRGNETVAAERLRAGLQRLPDEPALHHALGLLQFRTGQAEAATESLSRAAELAPDNPRYAYVFALALNGNGDSDRAVDLLAAAAERFPADFDIQWALATMLRDQGRNAEARAAAEMLDVRYPGIPSVTALLQSL